MFVTKVNELEQEIHNELISLIEKKKTPQKHGGNGVNVYDADVFFGSERIYALCENNVIATRVTTYNFDFKILGITQMAELVDYINSL